MKNMTRQEYVAHLRRYAEGVVSSACHLNINLTYSHHQYCSSHGHAHHHLNISMDGCRKSSGFSRGASMYRGVTRHHQHGRWQARIGRVSGNKDLYLGTFSMLLNMHGLTLPWFILFISVLMVISWMIYSTTPPTLCHGRPEGTQCPIRCNDRSRSHVHTHACLCLGRE
jgi:hypothetical protein